MKAVFLTRDNPTPATSGYKKRNFYLIEMLRKRGIETTVNPMQDSSCGLKKLTALVSNAPYSVNIRTDNKKKQELKELCPIDLLICDGIHRSQNIPFDITGCKVLYEHNVESNIVKKYLQIEKNPLKKLFACAEYLKFKSLEKRMWSKFDYCAVCSEVDKETVRRVTGKNNVIVVDNGVDSAYFKPDPLQPEKNTLIYTGQIGWFPNEDALMYFTKQILPLIKRSVPDVKLWIVGDKPSRRIQSLATPDIKITGFVPDVRPYLAKASVFIVPLRIGSGTRLKILEAMSMKKAIVTTSIGCEGLKVEDGKHLLIRDNPKDFAQTTVELLKNESLHANLGENGRKLIEERYDWSKVFDEFDQLLENLNK